MSTARSLPLYIALALAVRGAAPSTYAAGNEPSPGWALPDTGDARSIVREATLAVRGDSVRRVRERWSRLLQRNPADRAAALGLATLARLGYEYDDAARRYRALFATDAARADSYDAQARLGLGLALEAQGMSGAPVLTLYEQALRGSRIIGDPATEGSAHFRLGNTLAPLGRIPEAFAHFDSASRVLPVDVDDVRATLRCRRAQILLAIAGSGAADSLRNARTDAERAGDDEARAVCLRATALDYMLRGQQDSMFTADRALIELRRQMRDRSGLAVAYTLHADHRRSQGDFGEALRIFRQALAEANASHNHYIEATVTLGLGGTALTLNDHAAAAQYVERAISAFEAAHDSGSLMLALSFRPFVTMAAGDLAGARQQTLAILPFWRKQQDWTHLAELLQQLATIEMRAGNDAAAVRALDEADAAAHRAQSPASIATVAYQRGMLALHRGDPGAAERGFTQFLAAMDTAEHLMRHDGRVHLAEVYARRGNASRAEQELAGAGAELDTWRATLSDPELRTFAFQASPFEANDRNASVAVVLAALVRAGRAEAAFDLAERRRARELAERLTRTRALIERRAEAGSAPRPDSAHTAVAPTLSLAAVARSVPDARTAILQYVTGTNGAPTSLFVVARDAPIAAYVLPPADSLVDVVSKLVTLLEGGDDPAAVERALGAALLDSALRSLGDSISRLVIVPDGPLHRVPWDALRLPDGRYAVDRFAVGVAPSATVAATLWRMPRSAAGPSRILAFGDPALPNAVAAQGDETYRSAFDAAGGLPRLPNSAREARTVARYADDATVRLGAEASADFLERASLADFDVLHFATHALVDDRAAMRNALALAPGGIDDDGFVSAGDLAALHLDAALVVLSACRSAGGVVVDGEGVQGLTAPLLSAGAHSVVATMWRISDRRTVPFVESFYAALARGLPVAEALRSAKLAARDGGAPPRDWAAFTAVGDPLVTVPLHEPRRTTRWGLTLLVALVLFGGGIIIVLRRRPRAV